MGENMALDMNGQAWFAQLESHALGTDSYGAAVMEYAMTHAAAAGPYFAESLHVRRSVKRSPTLLEPVTAAYLAYYLVEFAERYEAPQLLDASVRERIRRVIGACDELAANLLTQPRGPAALMALTAELHRICASARVRKLRSELELAPSVAAAMAGARRFVLGMAERELAPPEPAVPDQRQQDHISTNRTAESGNVLLNLTGGALGFTGADQIRVDLCLAFGVMLRDYLRDMGGLPLVDGSEASVTVVVAGFLGAAPVASSQWQLALLDDELRAARIEVVTKRVGIDLRPLLGELHRQDSHRYLALLAKSLKDSLARAGVEMPEELLLELPGRFAVSGSFLEEAAMKAGVAEVS